MGVLVQCDKCKGGAHTSRRYGLRLLNARGVYESAGSIILCDGCWAQIARPRMIPNRRPRRFRNQHSQMEG